MELSEINDMKLKLEALIESELNKFHRITGLEMDIYIRDFDITMVADRMTTKHYQVKIKVNL